MSTSLTGAIKTIIAGLPAPLATMVVTRDEVATKSPAQAFPYITIQEGIASSRHPSSGRGVIRITDLAQVDLWQQRGAEDWSLRFTIERALDAVGMINLDPNGLVYRLLVESYVRLYEKATRTVHEALTVRAVRGI